MIRNAVVCRRRTPAPSSTSRNVKIGRRTESVRREEERTAERIARAWRLIAGGMSVADAARMEGFGENTAPLYPLPRPESEIRAELARQLRATYHKFWADVRLARVTCPG
jgi:hypothetical protein